MAVSTRRKSSVLIPRRLRSSIVGSADQARKVVTSMDICCTVALVPSAYSTASSASGGGMAI